MVIQNDREPTTKDFQDALDQLRTDPNFLRAAENLDKARFQDALDAICESLVTYINFEAYKPPLQFLKARLSKLSPEAEALYAERVDQAVRACQRCLGAAEAMSALFSQSGFDAVLTAHKDTLFRLTPAHPYADPITRLFGRLGVNDADIAHDLAWLKGNNWDPFRLGTGETFAGLVQSLKDKLPAVEQEMEAVKRYGVPVIEGSDPISVFVGVVVIGFAGFVSCLALNNIQPGNCIVPI